MENNWDTIHYLSYHIKKEDTDCFVLTILQKKLHLTTKKIRSVKYEERGILLDGERVTVRARVREGQCLQVMLNDVETKADHILPTKMSLTILYEDADFLFLNKPAGMVSHPSKGHYNDSLANGVKAYFLEKKERSSVHLIGRLDKETSGILCVAKNAVATERMIAARKEGTLVKEYYALVKGCPNPSEGWIDTAVLSVRDPENDRLKMQTSQSAQAKSARTFYRVKKCFPEFSMVSLKIQTGRTHQIRLHLASKGHPLLGDTLYGDGNGEADVNPWGLKRTALHAAKLTCVHPFTGELLRLEAELPEDMRNYIGTELS